MPVTVTFTRQMLDSLRPHGGNAFVEAVLARAEVDGESVKIDKDILREIRAAHTTQPQKFGLGDAVAAVAQPIARAIDAVAGTKIHECGGCKKRQAALNGALPDILHPFSK